MLKRGFTLIELLVVVAIIGIVSGIVVVTISDARKRGIDAGVAAQFNQFKTQMELNNGASGYSCSGQPIRNIVEHLIDLTGTPSSVLEGSTNTSCYLSGNPLTFTTNPVCGCQGGPTWFFWINLGDYDDVGGADYFTCIGSNNANVLQKLISGGGNAGACQAAAGMEP